MSNCWVNGKADVCVTRKYIELPGILEQPGALCEFRTAGRVVTARHTNIILNRRASYNGPAHYDYFEPPGILQWPGTLTLLQIAGRMGTARRMDIIWNG